MVASPSALLTLTPSSPNAPAGTYRPVILGIAGDPPMVPVNGSGGWQVVDRPKQVAATQWYDRPPWQITITAYIDPSVTGVSTTPDNDVAQLMSWTDAPTVTSKVIQPPTLTLKGPIRAATKFTWVMYNLEFDEGIRDFQSGALVSQKCIITLYEYNPPFPSTDVKKSPAGTAQKKSSAGATKKYVIKAGDTLASIATLQMKGSSLSIAAREGAIVALNAGDSTLNFRSPHQVLNILQGKTIKIPSS